MNRKDKIEEWLFGRLLRLAIYCLLAVVFFLLVIVWIKGWQALMH